MIENKINSKNILLISKYGITPTYGNPTRHFFLCKYLAKKGFQVDLVTSQSAPLRKYESFSNLYIKEELSGFSHFLLRGPKINLGFSIKRIISWLIFEFNILRLARSKNSVNKPDVIIVSSLSILTFLTGLYLKKKYKSKLILEVRDIWPLTLVDVGGYSKNNPIVILLGFIEKRGYRKADAIVGTMPNLQKHIKNILLNYNKNNIYHVPQGFDGEVETEIEKSNNFTQNLFQIKSSKFNVIYAGTIGKANKIDVILEVAKSLVENDNIHFYIMGDGPFREKYEMDSKDSKNLTFLKSIPSKEVFLFLMKFDLLILIVDDSPIYQYGISLNKSIDYMRSGVPFIYSYNGFPSLIEEEKYSFKVKNNIEEIAEKLVEISQIDKKELIKMGEEGKRIAKKHHSFDALADIYINIFKSIGAV